MKTILKLFLVSLIISFTSCETENVSSESDFLETGSREPIKAKGCETAFAFDKDAMCFLDDDDLNSNRWGWTIGPLSAPHLETYEIHQGAGQCNLDNGQMVGTLTVDYQLNGDLFIDYEAFDGKGFYESHLFVGDEKYPRKHNGTFTVAPGQFPFKYNNSDGVDHISWDLSGISGDIYVIAHAVVCEYDKKDDKN